jgi:FixJ family two-component response regulator
VGQGARERLELVGIRSGLDPQAVDLTRQHARLERHIVGNLAPRDAGLELDRHRLYSGGGRRERQILRGVVAGINPQQRHQIAEALDEGRRGVHAAVLRCWEGGE